MTTPRSHLALRFSGKGGAGHLRRRRYRELLQFPLRGWNHCRVHGFARSRVRVFRRLILHKRFSFPPWPTLRVNRIGFRPCHIDWQFIVHLASLRQSERVVFSAPHAIERPSDFTLVTPPHPIKRFLIPTPEYRDEMLQAITLTATVARGHFPTIQHTIC